MTRRGSFALGLVSVCTGVALAVSGCSSSSGTSSSTGTSNDQSSGTPKPSSSASLFAQLPSSIQKSGVIKAANPLSNPPYAFKKADGSLAGVAPDLATALEPMLGVKFTFTNTPFPGLIPGLKAGKFDMIWGSVTDTKEREATLNFVDYEKDGAILLVLKGNPKSIKGVDDSLCGKSASGLAGSIQLTLLSAQSKKCSAAGKAAIKVKTFQDVPSAELALRSGQVDTFMSGLGAGLYQVRTAGNGTLYETAGPIYQAAVLGAGFQKSDTKLSGAIQAGLKVLVADGTYAKIMAKYGVTNAALTADQITLNGAGSAG